MTTPEYPRMDAICEELESASFSVKMRGYAPDEVDAFMDSVVTRLKQAEEKLTEVRQYEIWLRDELHGQVVDRARGEALQIMQEAQDKARMLLEAAQADIAREQAEARRQLQQEIADQSARKAALEREVYELRQRTDAYRAQSVRMLKEGLQLLEQGQQADRGETPLYMHANASPEPSVREEPQTYQDPAAYTSPIPSYSEPPVSGALHSVDDIDRLLTEIRKEVR